MTPVSGCSLRRSAGTVSCWLCIARRMRTVRSRAGRSRGGSCVAGRPCGSCMLIRGPHCGHLVTRIGREAAVPRSGVPPCPPNGGQNRYLCHNRKRSPNATVGFSPRVVDGTPPPGSAHSRRDDTRACGQPEKGRGRAEGPASQPPKQTPGLRLCKKRLPASTSSLWRRRPRSHRVRAPHQNTERATDVTCRRMPSGTRRDTTGGCHVAVNVTAALSPSGVPASATPRS